MDNLPHYIITADEVAHQLDYVSLVAEPAIMEMGLAFTAHKLEDTDTLFKFSSNKDRQIIAGPAMIPDVAMYRKDDSGEFYVTFTKEAIEQLADKFNKSNKEYKVNVDHKDVVKSAFIKANWIIEDPKNDKSKMYGFNYPVGTWMVEVKIEDSEFWNNEIKELGRYGFSVEGLFGLKQIEKFKKIEPIMNKTVNEIKALFAAMTPEEIAALSPEELAALKALSPELFPAEEAEAPAEDAAETPADEIPAEEAATEDAPAEVEASDMSGEVLAIVQPKMDDIMAAMEAKYDELMSVIAELKSKMEEAPSEAEAPTEFANQTRSSFIKSYRKRFEV